MRNSGTKSFKFWNFRNIKELFNLENWLSRLQTVRPICPDVPSLDPRNTYFDISRESHRSIHSSMYVHGAPIMMTHH